MSRRTSGRVAPTVIIIAATLVGGIWGGRAFSQSDTGAQRVESAYTEALSVISDNYVEEIDYGKANEAAIQGMLWTLDPHSNYFNPQEYRRGASGKGRGGRRPRAPPPPFTRRGVQEARP